MTARRSITLKAGVPTFRWSRPLFSSTISSSKKTVRRFRNCRSRPRRSLQKGNYMVAVRTFLNRMEADLASGVLAGENIDSIVQADDCGGERPSMWLSGVRLLVRPEDAQKADEILREVTAAAPDAI